MLPPEIKIGNFYMTRITYPAALDEVSPLEAPAFDECPKAYTIDSVHLREARRADLQTKPRVALVVWHNGRDVYFLVGTRSPLYEHRYVALAPAGRFPQQPSPITPIPSNALRSAGYLNFTQVVHGRPVVCHHGRWGRAPINGPGDVRVRPLGQVASNVPVSISDRDLKYLWRCHIGYWEASGTGRLRGGNGES